ncbi:hypothetical protein [Cohnella lupini]|uniref:hypothetical protein n=1 Tax=Cohnella lupini TaxID=1294267 RepID=UPI001FE9847D|nr:hypothetical protein [Cohnella lupini]
MKKEKVVDFQKNANQDSSDWEERLRLSPDEIAEREASVQIKVEEAKRKQRLQEIDEERERRRQNEEAERERVEKEKKAKKRKLAAEEKRLRESYKELPPDLMRIADGLIQRAAFMRMTLEIYEHDLDENGYVEMFSQSKDADPYERVRPVAQLYSTMNANYQKIIKQLADLVPVAPPIPKVVEKDQFEDLLARKTNG